MNICATQGGSIQANLLQRLAQQSTWGEATSTPEWKVITKAFENKNRPVLAVALEVFLSHYPDNFTTHRS